MKQFDIPIVLFMFKRTDKTIQIIERISEIRPSKIYLLGDEGRNEEERNTVKECRQQVEKKINWECEVIKNYAKENRGVYDNIALGAMWVLKREKMAIFLEDDNLPEITFFQFCKEMLIKYEKQDEILWICGTNYLEKYKTKDKTDYVFTRHMLPCGWASWSKKFLEYYDGELVDFTEENIIKMKKNYLSNNMYEYDIMRIAGEKEKQINNQKFISWDYQMAFSIRHYNKLGIVPIYNQITNIGVDNDSIHGGNTFYNIMTKRFCGIKSHPLNRSLKHPTSIEIDEKFELKINKIVIPPKQAFYKKVLRSMFKIPKNVHIITGIKKTFTGNRDW